MLFYLITFTPTCFALAVLAIIAKLRPILLNKICKTLYFLCHFVNSAHDGQFCTRWPILHKILHAQNHRILTSLHMSVIGEGICIKFDRLRL